MKDAVLLRIGRLETDTIETHKLMLYLLRVFDNPSLLQADIDYLDSLNELKRQARFAKSKIVWWLLSLIGLLGTVIYNTIWFALH